LSNTGVYSSGDEITLQGLDGATYSMASLSFPAQVSGVTSITIEGGGDTWQASAGGAANFVDITAVTCSLTINNVVIDCNSQSWRRVIDGTGTSNLQDLRRLKIFGNAYTGASLGQVIRLNNTNGKLFNSLIYNCSTSGNGNIEAVQDVEVAYGNTLVKISTTGTGNIEGFKGVGDCRNNICMGLTVNGGTKTCYSGCTGTGATNGSDDATGPGTNKSIASTGFTDYTNNDFRVAPDSNVTGNGETLSSTYAIDLLGEDRSVPFTPMRQVNLWKGKAEGAWPLGCYRGPKVIEYTIGSGRTYSTPALFGSATGLQARTVAKGVCMDAVQYTGNIAFNTATPNVRWLTVDPSVDHGGVEGAGVRINGRISGPVGESTCPVVIVEGLEVYSSSNASLIYQYARTNVFSINRCLFHDNNSSGGGTTGAIYCWSITMIENSVIHSCEFTDASYATAIRLTARQAILRNVTIAKCGNLHASGPAVGIYSDNSAVTNKEIKNVAILGMIGGGTTECLDVSQFHASNDIDYCADDDGTFASWGAANTETISSSSFEDYANDDYNPSSGSTLIDNGVDLGTTYATDLAGTVRSGSWDIGAYEYIAVPHAVGAASVDVQPTAIAADKSTALSASNVDLSALAPTAGKVAALNPSRVEIQPTQPTVIGGGGTPLGIEVEAARLEVQGTAPTGDKIASLAAVNIEIQGAIPAGSRLALALAAAVDIQPAEPLGVFSSPLAAAAIDISPLSPGTTKSASLGESQVELSPSLLAFAGSSALAAAQLDITPASPSIVRFASLLASSVDVQPVSLLVGRSSSLEAAGVEIDPAIGLAAGGLMLAASQVEIVAYSPAVSRTSVAGAAQLEIEAGQEEKQGPGLGPASFEIVSISPSVSKSSSLLAARMEVCTTYVMDVNDIIARSSEFEIHARNPAKFGDSRQAAKASVEIVPVGMATSARASLSRSQVEIVPRVPLVSRSHIAGVASVDIQAGVPLGLRRSVLLSSAVEIQAIATSPGRLSVLAAGYLEIVAGAAVVLRGAVLSPAVVEVQCPAMNFDGNYRPAESHVEIVAQVPSSLRSHVTSASRVEIVPRLIGSARKSLQSAIEIIAAIPQARSFSVARTAQLEILARKATYADARRFTASTIEIIPKQISGSKPGVAIGAVLEIIPAAMVPARFHLALASVLDIVPQSPAVLKSLALQPAVLEILTKDADKRYYFPEVGPAGLEVRARAPSRKTSWHDIEMEYTLPPPRRSYAL
jgi:hypothetical protein